MAKSLLGFILTSVSLKEKTYYKMGGVAQYFAEPKTISEIQQCLFWAQKRKLPISVLGAGSNSVYADELFAGLVISLEKLSAWHWETEETLFVEAGVSNTEIAEICLASARDGAWWMYRMPGQLGASVRMNARCYGGEISQIVERVFTINLSGCLNCYSAQEIFLGYKSTLLMNKPEIVLGARLFLPNKKNPQELLKAMQKCEADRHKKNHFYMPSCGSTFKNNYNVGRPSGQIFDELNLKGTKIGNIQVSPFHANFVINMGGASTQDMLSLAAHMRHEALSKLNADLELEVQPVGLFSNKLFKSCAMERLGPHYPGKQNNTWVGLLHMPTAPKSKRSAAKALPKLLLKFPFVDYFQRDNRGVTQVFCELTQLTSQNSAKKNPYQPFLEWKTQVPLAFQNIFPLQEKVISQKENKFKDELWKLSVSELFIANAEKQNCYLEFEMTPTEHWVALEFDNVRIRNSKNKVPNPLLWKGVQTFSHSDNDNFYFGMRFSYAQLKKVLPQKGKSILLQCALSLGNSRYYLAPYWKQNKEGNMELSHAAPDFHQPQNYWLVELS